MKKGYICIDEDEMAGINHHLGKNQNELSQLSKTANRNFEVLTKTGLFGRGIENINNQLSQISDTVFKTGEIVKKESGTMIDLDYYLSNMFEQIEVPNNFVTKDPTKSAVFNSLTLEKEDGTAVNTKVISEIEKVKDDSSIKKEKLKYVDSKEAKIDESKISEYDIKRIDLSSISSQEEAKTSQLEDETVIKKKEQLSSILKEGSNEPVNFYENYTISPVTFSKNFKNNLEYEVSEDRK